MTTYNNTEYWFNVKNNELTLKIDGRVYTVDIQHVQKKAFLMVHTDQDVIWFNETKSGRAYRTYINDVIYIVPKIALDNVVLGNQKGTTLSIIEE